MTEKRYNWNNIENDEQWSNCEFGSINECIQDVIECAKEYELPPGARISINTLQRYEPVIDACDVLEQIEDDAYEEFGDAALNWLRKYWKGKGRTETKKLEKKLNDVLKKWLHDNNLQPPFYKSVETGRVITITEDGYEED